MRHILRACPQLTTRHVISGLSEFDSNITEREFGTAGLFDM
jgi:hypothetical protein